MTVRPNIHINDFGMPIIMTITSRTTKRALPLAGLVTATFKFQAPTLERTFERTAELVSPPGGADGKLQYYLVDGDIDEAGDWQIQAFIVDTSGQWHSDIETFTVGENIEIESS